MADKVALEPLYVGYALAHNKGDTVPAENVGPNNWGDKVAGADSAKGKAAVQEAQESTLNVEVPVPETGSSTSDSGSK